MTNYIVEHWFGRQSLVRTYWINSVVLSWVVGFLIGFLLAASGIAEASIVKATYITSIPYLVWAWVGVWRASDVYSADHPAKWWGGLAKAGVIVGFIMFMANILK